MVALAEHYLYIVGTNGPFAHPNPSLRLSSAVALMQTTFGASKLCGKTSIFAISKFLHEVLVLHSTMMASVWLRFGRPTLYQAPRTLQQDGSIPTADYGGMPTQRMVQVSTVDAILSKLKRRLYIHVYITRTGNLVGSC